MRCWTSSCHLINPETRMEFKFQEIESRKLFALRKLRIFYYFSQAHACGNSFLVHGSHPNVPPTRHNTPDSDSDAHYFLSNMRAEEKPRERESEFPQRFSKILIARETRIVCPQFDSKLGLCWFGFFQRGHTFSPTTLSSFSCSF